MLFAAVLVPIWFVFLFVLRLGELFCSDGATAEECARQASEGNRFLFVTALGIVALFGVGAVRYARHPSSTPPAAHARARAPGHLGGEDQDDGVARAGAPGRRTVLSGPARRALVAEVLGVIAAVSTLLVVVVGDAAFTLTAIAATLAPLTAFPGAVAGLLAAAELGNVRGTSLDRRRATIGTVASIIVIVVILANLFAFA